MNYSFTPIGFVRGTVWPAFWLDFIPPVATKETSLIEAVSKGWPDIVKKAAADMPLGSLRRLNKTLSAFKTKEPKMKYDLKAMKFDPDSEKFTAFDGVLFGWLETPEGGPYWSNIHTTGQTTESRAKIQAMRDQYKSEVLPDIGVIVEYHGATWNKGLKGADVTVWFNGGSVSRCVECGNSFWGDVSHYLIHSHPEPKRITGTVAAYTDTPNFDTWVADPT